MRCICPRARSLKLAVRNWNPTCQRRVSAGSITVKTVFDPGSSRLGDKMTPPRYRLVQPSRRFYSQPTVRAAQTVVADSGFPLIREPHPGANKAASISVAEDSDGNARFCRGPQPQKHQRSSHCAYEHTKKKRCSANTHRASLRRAAPTRPQASSIIFRLHDENVSQSVCIIGVAVAEQPKHGNVSVQR